MAVLIPSLLPPPAPFKIFVLLAGVVGISAARFATAIAIGRGVRYFALGPAGGRYGDQAMAYMRENGTDVSLALVGVLAAAFAGYLLWSRAPSAGKAPINRIMTRDARAERRHPDPQRGAVARRAAPRADRDADARGDAPYEIIVVDDGSTDESFEILARLQAVDPHLRVIRFRRNFGQTAAFAAGFDARARPADRHLGRRPAERSARHPGDGRAARARATTSSAAGGRTGRTRSCRGGCRR